MIVFRKRVEIRGIECDTMRHHTSLIRLAADTHLTTWLRFS
jgi:hypothetical protein